MTQTSFYLSGHSKNKARHLCRFILSNDTHYYFPQMLLIISWFSTFRWSIWMLPQYNRANYHILALDQLPKMTLSYTMLIINGCPLFCSSRHSSFICRTTYGEKRKVVTNSYLAYSSTYRATFTSMFISSGELIIINLFLPSWSSHITCAYSVPLTM